MPNSCVLPAKECLVPHPLVLEGVAAPCAIDRTKAAMKMKTESAMAFSWYGSKMKMKKFNGHDGVTGVIVVMSYT